MIKFSVKKVSVASPSPKPKIRKAPNRSFNLMGIFLAASGRLLVKHFGAWWMLTFFQCWGSPISQTFIWLLNVIINNVWLCKIRSKMKHNLRQVKFQREFAVFFARANTNIRSMLLGRLFWNGICLRSRKIWPQNRHKMFETEKGKDRDIFNCWPKITISFAPNPIFRVICRQLIRGLSLRYILTKGRA